MHHITIQQHGTHTWYTVQSEMSAKYCTINTQTDSTVHTIEAGHCNWVLKNTEKCIVSHS